MYANKFSLKNESIKCRKQKLLYLSKDKNKAILYVKKQYCFIEAIYIGKTQQFL